MWNYYKTVVINSATAEDGHDMFFKSEVFSPEKNKMVEAASVWRNGQYDLAKVGKITKTVGYPGENAKLVLDCSKLIAEAEDGVQDLGIYQLTFNVEMDGKFLSDWASPEYKGFYKPFVVGLDVNEANVEKMAEYLCEQINLALAENNKFIKVSYEGNNLTIEATDNYMILKPENFKFEKYEVVGCDTCLGEYIPKKIEVEIVDGKQPFATGTWILENLRLPNTLNYRYFGSNDEMPLANEVYTQFTFDYTSDRPGLGGHSGVGQAIAAVTTHTFYVASSAVEAFKTAFGL